MSHDKKLVLPLDVSFWPLFGEYRLRRRRGVPRLVFDANKQQPPRTPENALDPWSVRNDFLLTRDGKGQDLDSFARKYGCFAARGVLTDSAATGPVIIRSIMASASIDESEPIGSDYLEDWRSFVRDLLLTPRQDWPALAKQYGESKVQRVMNVIPFKIEYDSSNRPCAVISAEFALDAILATIHIDLLDGLEFRECARPDCKEPPFKLTSGHERKYCSDPCAHLEAVRAHRRRQATDGENRKRKTARQDKVGGTK
jgi:hypothetical protein